MITGKPKMCPPCYPAVSFTARAPGKMKDISLGDFSSPSYCYCEQHLVELGARYSGLLWPLRNPNFTLLFHDFLIEYVLKAYCVPGIAGLWESRAGQVLPWGSSPSR